MKNRIWTFMLALTLLSACGGEGHPPPEAPEPPPMVRQEAFFYGYHEEALRPEREMRGEIIRNGVVTRADRGLLSLRIYASSCFMTAAHPNDWYAGLTMDLETGEALTLRDVLGPGRTVEELLESGAFRCEQVWDESLDREGAERLQIEEAGPYIRLDAAEDFYLTKDSLGLIGQTGHYSFYMEAPLSALGLEAWAS